MQSLQNAPSGGSLCFLPFLYKDIYIRIYISYKRRVSVCTSSESFCIEKCYPSFTKRKKIKVPKLFSVVFQHLCRQQRALAPLFCAKANPLPLESISLFLKKEKKTVQDLLIPLYTQNHKDSMSFPGISRVLNRFVEWVRTPTLFGHPRKNQSRKPNAKSTKPRSSRGKKTTSVIFQRSRLDKKKSQRWENTGRTVERRKTFPLFLAGKAAAGGSPSPWTGHRSRGRGWHRRGDPSTGGGLRGAFGGR